MAEVTPDILVRRDGGVLLLTLNRPAKKNALTTAMYQELSHWLQQADVDDTIRCVLLSGSGDSFCSGNDLGDFERRKKGEPSPGIAFLEVLAATRTPVVVAVNGLGVGIGATLLLHCDLIYAARGAWLRFPFVDLGLVPEAASSLLLPRLLGRPRAAELLLLGEKLGAEYAADLGLINACLDDDALLPHALHQARRLADLPRRALQQAKQLIRQPDAETVVTQMRIEAEHFSRLLHSAEAVEARRAIRERRRPDFRGAEAAVQSSADRAASLAKED
ncbi:enoyl-CoA hydratase [Marinobacterium nitratireducens]|uniref:Enoyl-CoA hydratase n=1 Tax=Marinobacterium nitratireducens TaxID=518897 RepID=A0A917ZG59_9GAMM|nr:enoyl-CoA hydratase-related protein [Marinobacterium nitratireducens]GGO81892.1 enoyl-CoA hydratase [Marinobacterium nitratireducens]